MMDKSENDRYITFSLDNVQEGLQNNISHEEICDLANECVGQNNLTEITVGNMNQKITETELSVKMLTENSDDDDEHPSVVYPIYIKQKSSQKFTSGDETMAIEALRQLGRTYPYSEDREVCCPNCTIILTHSEFMKHQSVCTSDKPICKTCGEKFERKIDLNNHIVCHQVNRPHACRTCGNLFRSKANLQTHMIKVHQIERPYKCNVCGADFQRPSSLSNHTKIHNYVAGRALIQRNNAITNVQTFKNISDLEDVTVLTAVQSLQNFEIPQWSVQAYNFNNDQCNNDANQLDKIDTLQEFTVLPNGEVTQLKCNAQSTQSHNFNLNNSEKLLKVETIDFIDKKQSAFVELNVQQKKDNICNHCGTSFATASSLTLHEKIHVNNTCGSPVECEYCDKQFQDVNFLAIHQTSCTKKLFHNSAETNVSNLKLGKHACSDCGKKFTTKQKMFRHQWIHRKKTHSCEVCSSQFEKQLELDEHRLSAHPGDSPFTCTECGKSFVSRQGLWEHGRAHAGSPAYFHCETCSKTFSSRQGYLIHHRTHTGERPYGCKFCWKAFRDGGTLRKHERIHTGERPHVCPLCTRAFNQKVVLREHVRWVHAAGKTDIDVTEPPFPCQLCGMLTQDRDELCAHIVKHSDKMIAEAKAKSNTVNEKVKSQKKKGKTKTTIIKGLEKQTILTSEQNETLLSLTQQVVNPTETQDTYYIIKNEYNDEMCIEAYTSDIYLGEPNESINVIAIAKSSDINGEVEKFNVMNGQTNANTMHLVPLNTSASTIHLISSNKPSNTLHLISKQNEDLPVLAIQNPETDANYSNQILQINRSQTPIIAVMNSLTCNNEMKANIHTETMIIEPSSVKDNYIEAKKFENEEVSDEASEELICGICGNDFDDKSVLMEHVKIHI